MCGTAVVGRQVAERLERRDPGEVEALDLIPADARDADEVVFAVPARVADWEEGAEPAVIDRVGVRLRPLRDRLLEPHAGPSIERRELSGPELLLEPGAEHDPHPLGQAPLDARKLVRVERELEHRGRLCAPRELRVDRLVRHAALVVLDLHEEVGEPAPDAVGEVRLVDDVGLPSADRLLREPPCLDGVEVLVVVGRKADDRLPLSLEPRQVCRLVLVALACDEVGLRVLARRRLRELAAQDGRGELGQVRAGEVGREVGRGEEQRAVVCDSHHLQSSERSVDHPGRWMHAYVEAGAWGCDPTRGQFDADQFVVFRLPDEHYVPTTKIDAGVERVASDFDVLRALRDEADKAFTPGEIPEGHRVRRSARPSRTCSAHDRW